MIIIIFIAITAFTYSYILTQPGELLGKVYGKLDSFFKTDKRISEGKGLHPIFKMVIACPKCVSGQMALWIYLFYNYKNYSFGLSIFISTLITHVLFIGTTIFLTSIINSLYQKNI